MALWSAQSRRFIRISREYDNVSFSLVSFVGFENNIALNILIYVCEYPEKSTFYLKKYCFVEHFYGFY